MENGAIDLTTAGRSELLPHRHSGFVQLVASNDSLLLCALDTFSIYYCPFSSFSNVCKDYRALFCFLFGVDCS